MSEIDPREFGKLEAQVEALQAEVHAHKPIRYVSRNPKPEPGSFQHIFAHRIKCPSYIPECRE